MNRFTLGTYERFLLPSYVLLSVGIGVGYWQSVEFAGNIARRIGSRVPGVWMGAIGLVLTLYPLSIAGVTMWRFWGIAGDRTAENLARDMLRSVSTGAILFLQRDTPLFTTQYARYALGVRPDVIVIHTSRLATEDYPRTLARVFPRLKLPAQTGNTFQVELLRLNRDQLPIFSNVPLAVDDGWVWVPYGLIYELVRTDQAPSVADLSRQNEELWNTYHDPAAGILSRYDHLMLSDVRDVYAGARFELGKTLLRAGETEKAKVQFEGATALGGDTQTADAYTFLGLSELFSKNCEAALAAFVSARQASITPDPSLLLYEGVTYRDCVGDVTRAKELLDAYESERKQAETPLKQ